MAGVWGGFDNRPTSPPAKQLMLPRLMNLLVNPFAKVLGTGQGSPQTSIFYLGGQQVLDGKTSDAGPPNWPFIEFSNPALGALKTGRSRILLPEDFVLFSYWASSSSNVKGGFRVMVYDVNRRMPLTLRPVNFNTLAGQGAAPLFLRDPYPFGRSVNNSPPQAKITVVNLETVGNTIQFGFLGFVIPNYKQGDPRAWSGQ